MTCIKDKYFANFYVSYKHKSGMLYKLYFLLWITKFEGHYSRYTGQIESLQITSRFLHKIMSYLGSKDFTS